MPKQGGTTARGYGRKHQEQRKQWAPLVATGTVRCARCGKKIKRGQPWDLGHTDDRASYHGPEHTSCNRSAAAVMGNDRRRPRFGPRADW